VKVTVVKKRAELILELSWSTVLFFYLLVNKVDHTSALEKALSSQLLSIVFAWRTYDTQASIAIAVRHRKGPPSRKNGPHGDI